MNQNEVLEFIEENGVKFVKLAFCDALGNLKNVSIFATELEDVFEKGMAIDEEAFDGIASYERGDIRLYPDPETMQVLPWRPQHGAVIRMYSHLKHLDGTIAECDGRELLRKAQENLAKLGYSCTIGSNCDFYLFELDEKGVPTHTPYDMAGYLDAAPLDKGENVRREICFTLERQGLKPTSSHHEKGPGQNEIRFNYNDALYAADDFMTFKSTVKSIAAGSGLYASFLPKPIENEEGSALMINVLLKKGNKECTSDSEETKHFLAGILNRIKDMTLFLNPTPNSYDRFAFEKSPKYIGWADQKFRQVMRVSKYKAAIYSADPSCNPYVAFALLLFAGAEGLEKKMELNNQVKELIVDTSKYETLPLSLIDAINVAKDSDFINKVMPAQHLAQFIAYKNNEFEKYNASENKAEFINEKYFGRI